MTSLLLRRASSAAECGGGVRRCARPGQTRQGDMRARIFTLNHLLTALGPTQEAITEITAPQLNNEGIVAMIEYSTNACVQTEIIQISRTLNGGKQQTYLMYLNLRHLFLYFIPISLCLSLSLSLFRSLSVAFTNTRLPPCHVRSFCKVRFLSPHKPYCFQAGSERPGQQKSPQPNPQNPFKGQLK